MRFHPQVLFLLGAVLMWARPSGAQAPKFEAPGTIRPSDAQLTAIRERTEALGALLERLRTEGRVGSGGHPDDAYADVAVYHKAAVWIVRHGEFYRPNYVDLTLKALDTGRARAEQLLSGRRPWLDGPGTRIRGYVSKVDRSIQPFAVTVPEAPLPEGERYRLDVILHGRGATLNEVSFINQHDGKPAGAEGPGLVLHVFGRVNNAYRWAGETDVFEAIDAVKRSYPVDERRILLRGFSMGGAGAWHLGLHHPDLWCAVEAGAGFTETRKYTRRDDYPDYQAKALRIYDAVDYALNAFNLPMAGYGGELDKQLQASVNIKEALEGLGFAMKSEGLVTRGEGLDFLHVVGARTEHKVDPASAEILKAFRDEHAEAGLGLIPRPVRFVTYTLKYNSAPGVSIERLKAHYSRALVNVTPERDGQPARVTAENVAVLGLDRRLGDHVRIGETLYPLAGAAGGLLPLVYFRAIEGNWELLDHEQSRAIEENANHEKAPGLQGPIDDAFTGPFLCVRGTGTPWNADVQKWADARLEEFAAVWSKSMRGELPIKNDADVTDDDIKQYHLVLFGDPGSNRWIERLANDLPVKWSSAEVALGASYPAAEHVPLLIALNPLNRSRYVVLNSGHTFGAREFAGTNALLYPHLGDYAIIRLNGSRGDVAASGYFDEQWRYGPQR